MPKGGRKKVFTGGASPVGDVLGGDLEHDGPATPEQISLVMDATGLSSSATATCRYRTTAGPGDWVTGHPLYRVQPTFSGTPAVGTVDDVFAWPIIDLEPGTEYEVEVTVTDGAASDIKTLTHTTRSLPAASGAANKTITS